MKTIYILTGTLLFTPLLTSISKAADQEEPKPKESATASMSEAEKKFQNTLANCTFKGRWCLIKDGELGEEREDKYTILRASKTGGDNWLIFARVQYNNKDVTVPIPVQLKWAGDTPVITLDNMAIPNLGTYSARVVVHDNSYAGNWSAGDHSGMLYGLIEKTKEGEAKPKTSSP